MAHLGVNLCWWFRNPIISRWNMQLIHIYPMILIHPRWLFGISSITFQQKNRSSLARFPWSSIIFRIVWIPQFSYPFLTTNIPLDVTRHIGLRWYTSWAGGSVGGSEAGAFSCACGVLEVMTDGGKQKFSANICKCKYQLLGLFMARSNT